MSDLDLHRPAIVAGDLDAFARWVAGAEPRLRASLRGFARTVDTEAVLQETLLRVWQVAARCAGDGRPDGLLRMAQRIARNLAISEARRRRIDFVAPGEVPDPGQEDPAPQEAGLLARWIAECRRRLSRQPARAFDARLEAAGAVPDRDLAERLGMKLDTFLRNVSRARSAMAECLRRKGVDLEAWTS